MISITKIFSIFFLTVTFESILRWSIIPDVPSVFWWLINILIIICAIALRPYYLNNDVKETPLLFVKLFLIWIIIGFFRGLFVAENYWEWKNLIATTFVFFIPFFSFLFINKEFLKKITSFWYKYMLIVGILIIPFVNDPTFLGHYYSPILLLLLVLPLLSYKWKLIVIAVVIGTFLFGLESRSTIIKLSVAVLLGLLYYIKKFQIERFFKFFHTTFFVLPIILLILAATNTFNVFNLKEYTGLNKNTSQKYSQEDLSADTRTFLYIENINSALKHDYVIEGRTPARGYDSTFFGDFLKWELGTGKRERFASEVSILNVFTWYGIIGVILYSIIFFTSSYLAIYRSNNYFIKIIGLFVAFRWLYAFVEDFTSFGIQYIFLWVFISMGLSSSFRKMTNEEFKFWIQNLLRKSQLFKVGR